MGRRSAEAAYIGLYAARSERNLSNFLKTNTYNRVTTVTHGYVIVLNLNLFPDFDCIHERYGDLDVNSV